MIRSGSEDQLGRLGSVNLRQVVGTILFNSVLSISSIILIRLLTRIVQHQSSEFAFDAFASKVLACMSTTTFMLAVTTFGGVIATDTFLLLKDFVSSNRGTRNEN